MPECLDEIIYYSKIVMKLEDFTKKCVNDSNYSTQVYESFSQCLIEYLRYFKQNLNKYGTIIVTKGILIKLFKRKLNILYLILYIYS